MSDTESSESAPNRPSAGGASPLAAKQFIQLYEGALASATCRDIIARFERDPRRGQSRTEGGRIDSGRTGTQLEMASEPAWADLKRAVTEAATHCLHDYARRFPAIEFLLKSCPAILTSPIIERVDPGQGFDWHVDSGPMGSYRRFLSALIYLNDIADGGTTDFPLQGISIRPREGTVVMFPPYWMYPHRGSSPAGTIKYKMTTYFMIEG